MIYSHQNLIEFAELTTRAKRPLHNNHHVWKWEGEMKEEKYFAFCNLLAWYINLTQGKTPTQRSRSAIHINNIP